MDKNTAETVVKIYAVLAWVGAFFSVIGALALMGLGALGGGMMSGYYGMMGGGWLAGIGVFFGVFMIALAVLEVFVGLGLWRKQEWARIVTLVFGALGVLSILGLNIIGAAIGAVTVWLFGFEPTVTGLFGAKPFKTK